MTVFDALWLGWRVIVHIGAGAAPGVAIMAVLWGARAFYRALLGRHADRPFNWEEWD